MKSAEAATPVQYSLLELYAMLFDGYDPAGTREQFASLVAALLTVYFPEIHIVQAELPAEVEYEPTQEVQAELPAKLYFPAAHVVHTLSAVLLTASLYLPAAHAVHTLSALPPPIALYLPAAQEEHTELPA